MRFLMLLFAMSGLFAERIDGMIITGENQACVVLSDGSFWKASALQRRWRWPLEWLRGDDLGVPREFLTDVTEWGVGKEVALCLKPIIDDSNLSNQEEIRMASHLMVDAGTGMMLLATPMTAQFGLEGVYTAGGKVSFDRGYNKGYEKGYDKGREEGTAESFQRGFMAGVKSLNPLAPPPYGAQ